MDKFQTAYQQHTTFVTPTNCSDPHTRYAAACGICGHWARPDILRTELSRPGCHVIFGGAGLCPACTQRPGAAAF